MKRFSFLLLGNLLLVSAAHAQFGVRVGSNITKVHITDDTPGHSSSGSLAGYQVGLFYQLPLAPHLALVPEVQYSNERFTLTQSDANSASYFGANLRQRHEYLNVPLLVRATWGLVYLEAGPQAKLLLSVRQTGEIQLYNRGGSLRTTVDQDLTSIYRSFDVGPCVGVGVKLPAGLSLNVRAFQGLLEVNPQSSGTEGKYKKQTAQASLIYQLPARQ